VQEENLEIRKLGPGASSEQGHIGIGTFRTGKHWSGAIPEQNIKLATISCDPDNWNALDTTAIKVF
jgi:hypothetical protein